MWTNRDVIVTVASWEDRFLLGFCRLLDRVSVTSVIILYSDRYKDWTAESRKSAQEECDKRSIQVNWGILYDDEPFRTWNETLTTVFASVPDSSAACVDITTMPREVIWQCLWFLELRKCDVGYVYNRPEKYGDWLSRDPDRPRLVYKMSGIARLGTRTALLIMAGYDVDRVKHLSEVFEPSVTLLGLQEDNVDQQNTERMKEVERAFEGDSTVRIFRADAFSEDRGRAAIATALDDVVDSHNVVMASMGPKLSALSLYELHRKNESLGLVYLPSREFNQDYSSGIGESMYGEINSD